MRGDGLDFCEIRPYQAGDDIRKINFSASGKTGELQTNVFNVILNYDFQSVIFIGYVRLYFTLH
jgi:hypothetical protein